MFDRDNSGAIEFNEFYALWQYVTDWQRTFRSYDQDNSGTIDRQELKIGKFYTDRRFLAKTGGLESLNPGYLQDCHVDIHTVFY